jgi:hypothetical protein
MKIAQPNIIDITPESSVLIIFRGALEKLGLDNKNPTMILPPA